MLYDPKWEKQTKADPFSLDVLIAWIKQKPASETYCYQDHGHCLFGQYFTACGFRDIKVGGYSITHADSPYTLLPLGWDNVAADGPHTFGAALERARALQS